MLLYADGVFGKKWNNFKYENEILSESELFQRANRDLKQHFVHIKKDKVCIKSCEHILNIL